MAYSLNLPYWVCLPLTQAVRGRTAAVPICQLDQERYFHEQHSGTAKLDRFLEGIDFTGRNVLDVGSGLGGRAIAWLERGASSVLNIDINAQELAKGREIVDASYPKQASNIGFAHPESLNQGPYGDLAILCDSFEHLTDPGAVLSQIFRWLRPGGVVWVGSIGWYHYLGSHCVGWHIPIPWCHLLFSESAIIKTIQTIVRQPGYVPNVWERLDGVGRWDGVTTLRDRPGEPLNMLSLRAVRNIMRSSPFVLERFRVHGFAGTSSVFSKCAAPLARIPILRELFHSYYTAVLIKVEEEPNVS